MLAANRRYDIDWLRVIAIGLLLLYHVAIGFQPWGIMIGFMTNDKPLVSLWPLMAMLNVWRIPLLFFVSGMGVYFAMQNRNWKQLLKERAGRILIPFVFGIFCIVPIHVALWQQYYHWAVAYQPSPGHLWFLGNIFSYVLLLLPLFYYLKRNEQGAVVTWIKKIMSNPLGLVLVTGAFIAEALLVNPEPYEMYAMTWHGFLLGLLGFLFGFCFALSGPPCWNMLVKWRWLLFALAALLYTYRLLQPNMSVPVVQLVVESNAWIFTLFTFAHKYLNRSGKALRYLSEAAYPIYIIHMAFLFLGSLLIFPLNIPVLIKFIALLLFTGIGCFACYEFIIKRVPILRPLFGLKMR
jgi:hypothetical protein